MTGEEDELETAEKQIAEMNVYRAYRVSACIAACEGISTENLVNNAPIKQGLAEEVSQTTDYWPVRICCGDVFAACYRQIEGGAMATITRERLEWLSNISGRDDIEDICGDEIRELARIALAVHQAIEASF